MVGRGLPWYLHICRNPFRCILGLLKNPFSWSKVTLLLRTVDPQSSSKWMMSRSCVENDLFAYRPTVALIGYGTPVCVESGSGQGWHILIWVYLLQCLWIVQTYGCFPTLYCYRIIITAFRHSQALHEGMKTWKWPYQCQEMCPADACLYSQSCEIHENICGDLTNVLGT